MRHRRPVLCLVELRGFEPPDPLHAVDEPATYASARSHPLPSVSPDQQLDGIEEHGAGCGVVRLSCWQIAGGSGIRTLSITGPESAQPARPVQCSPQEYWVEDLRKGRRRAPERRGGLDNVFTGQLSWVRIEPGIVRIKCLAAQAVFQVTLSSSSAGRAVRL